MPFAMSMDCLLGNSSKQKNEIAFVIRQYAVVSVAWLLYVAKEKTRLSNMWALVTVIIITYIFATLWEGKTILGDSGECSSATIAQWWWPVGWPTLALIFAHVEHHVNGRGTTTAGEREALV